MATVLDLQDLQRSVYDPVDRRSANDRQAAGSAIKKKRDEFHPAFLFGRNYMRRSQTSHPSLIFPGENSLSASVGLPFEIAHFISGDHSLLGIDICLTML